MNDRRLSCGLLALIMFCPLLRQMNGHRLLPRPYAELEDFSLFPAPTENATGPNTHCRRLQPSGLGPEASTPYPLETKPANTTYRT